jgi:hypothetical protein
MKTARFLVQQSFLLNVHGSKRKRIDSILDPFLKRENRECFSVEAICVVRIPVSIG